MWSLILDNSNKLDGLIKLSEAILTNAILVLNREDYEIKFKSENDAVSSVDLSLEQMIINFISRYDPKSPVISEENLTHYDKAETVWLIDPLDGTSNFIQNLKPTCISIAKVKKNKVLEAIVIDLSNSDIYLALKGLGAYLNGNRISPKPALIKLIGLSTGYFNNNYKIPLGWNARIFGSQALHLCYVSKGSLSVSISIEAKAWDDAAGSLIISESGGHYENQYPDIDWQTLALNNMSLCSRAIMAKESYDEIKDLVGIK